MKNTALNSEVAAYEIICDEKSLKIIEDKLEKIAKTLDI